MRTVDDFLIDQVCQPVVDRLPGSPAPALVGQHFILAGAAVCSVALVLMWRAVEVPWAIGFGIAAVGTSIHKAFEAGRGTAGVGVAPVSRLRDFPQRMLNLAFAVVLIALAPVHGEWLLTLSQALLASGLYAAACRRPPPRTEAAVANSQPIPAAEAALPG